MHLAAPGGNLTARFAFGHKALAVGVQPQEMGADRAARTRLEQLGVAGDGHAQFA